MLYRNGFTRHRTFFSQIIPVFPILNIFAKLRRGHPLRGRTVGLYKFRDFLSPRHPGCYRDIFSPVKNSPVKFRPILADAAAAATTRVPYVSSSEKNIAREKLPAP